VIAWSSWENATVQASSPDSENSPPPLRLEGSGAAPRVARGGGENPHERTSNREFSSIRFTRKLRSCRGAFLLSNSATRAF